MYSTIDISFSISLLNLSAIKLQIQLHLMAWIQFSCVYRVFLTCKAAIYSSTWYSILYVIKQICALHDHCLSKNFAKLMQDSGTT